MWLTELISLPGMMLFAVPVGLFMTTAVMPETPLLFFVISLTLVCAYAAYSGLEVLGCMAELIAPLIILAVVLIFGLLIADMDLKVLTPVLEKVLFPVVHGAFTTSARTNEIIGFAMLLPYLNDWRKGEVILITTFALVVSLFLLITISTQTVLGVEVAKNTPFPYFRAIRLVHIGDFLERIEVVHMGIWVLGVFMRIALCYYLAVLGLGQLLNLKTYKPLVLPVGTVIISLSILIAPNLVELREFTSYKIITWYAVFFILVMPTALFILAFSRKEGEKQKCTSELSSD